MKSRRQTIVASVLLAAVFTIPSYHFARENAELTGRSPELRRMAKGTISGMTGSKNLRQAKVLNRKISLISDKCRLDGSLPSP